MLYVDLRAEVLLDKVRDKELIEILIGLKQGCPCSPLLFSVYFDRIHKYVEEKLRASARGRRINGLMTVLSL